MRGTAGVQREKDERDERWEAANSVAGQAGRRGGRDLDLSSGPDPCLLD